MRSVLCAVLIACSSGAIAEGGMPVPESVAETSFGRPGDPQKASLAIKAAMTDDMRFTPAEIRVKVGDTVRFIVANEGMRERQMVLGTMDALKRARRGEPNEVDVAPGKTGELAWQFTEIGEFYYGFAGGRVGKVLVY